MLSLKDPFLVDYKRELLRWNKQISLVSRRKSGHILDNLLHQSSCGFSVFHTYVNNFVNNPLDNFQGETGDNPVDKTCGDVFYWDLGSGGGLPGVVWSHQILNNTRLAKCYLVEPREKRSWFLERIVSLNLSSVVPDGSSVDVIPGRWGEDYSRENQSDSSSLYIISLKALHLADSEVLAGLFSFFGKSRVNGDVFIARYYPGPQKMDDVLVSSLGLPSVAGDVPCPVGCSFQGCDILPVPPAGFLPSSLVVSRYKLLSS
jgi:hypothetical protein